MVQNAEYDVKYGKTSVFVSSIFLHPKVFILILFIMFFFIPGKMPLIAKIMVCSDIQPGSLRIALKSYNDALFKFSDVYNMARISRRIAAQTFISPFNQSFHSGLPQSYPFNPIINHKWTSKPSTSKP